MNPDGRDRTAGVAEFTLSGANGIRELRDEKRGGNDAQTRFQLTDPGHLKHDKNASVASLRP